MIRRNGFRNRCNGRVVFSDLIDGRIRVIPTTQLVGQANVWCQTPNVRMQNGESTPVTVFVNELEICDTTGGLCSAADRRFLHR